MHPITRTTTLRKTTAGGKYNKIERQYLVHGHAGLLPVMPESQDDDLRASACALAWDFGFAVRGNGGRGVRGGHTGRRGGRGARWEVPVLAPSGQQGAGGVARPVLLAENRLIHCPACAEVGERVRHPPLVLPCARLAPWPPCARLLRSDAVEKRRPLRGAAACHTCCPFWDRTWLGSTGAGASNQLDTACLIGTVHALESALQGNVFQTEQTRTTRDTTTILGYLGLAKGSCTNLRLKE